MPFRAAHHSAFSSSIFRRIQDLIASQLQDGICPTCLGVLNTPRSACCTTCQLRYVVQDWTATQHTIYNIAIQIASNSIDNSQPSTTLSGEASENKSLSYQNNDPIATESLPN